MFHPPEKPLGPRVPVKADRFTPSPPKPKGGLQRQKGSSQLEMAVKPPQETKLKPSTSSTKLIHSASMVNLTTTRAPSAAPLSSAPSTTTNIYAKQYIPRSGRSVSTLRHASAEPRRAGGPAPFRIEPTQHHRLLVEGFPTSFSSKKVEKLENSGESESTTPPPSLTSSESDSGASGAPGLIRSASGSMLLRRTAERTRRQSESPKKTMRRSGSVGGACGGVGGVCEKGGACERGGVLQKESEDVEMKETPVLKRKRTTSMTSLLQSISTADDAPPIFTPQRTRPLRGASVGGGGAGGGGASRSPMKSLTKKMTSSASPMKKRGRPEEGGGVSQAPPSPRKRIHFSSMAMGMGGVNDVPIAITIPSQPLASTPIRNLRQSVFKPVSEHIERTYGTPLRKSGTTTDVRPPTVPPKLVTRSTSGEIYYSANEDDVATPKRKVSKEEVYSTPLEFGKGESMVPLVQKQISIDSSTSSTFMTSEGLIDDNGSNQESMRTIKKGQQSSLSRCSSLKITPVTTTQNSNTGELEKSISTQSLHTTTPSTSSGSAPSATLVRHNSTPIFRFKVSPSSYKPPAAPAPVEPEATVIPTVTPMETTVTPPPEVTVDQMPSTSSSEDQKTSEDVVKEAEDVKKPKKSSLREPLVEFPQRDDYGASRARKIRFSGLDVHYFDRLQGSLTVPKEGCVTLAMHTRHHTHRHFSLSSGRRPPLNLELYEDGELSEDEVIHPDDSDDVEEEVQTTKHMDPIEPKQRIQILKKSGVKLEKNGGAEAMKTLRTLRSICGCDCPGGACDPSTCQCSLDGINCQVDGSAQHPCTCQAHLCRNPQGRSFYDEEAVRGYRRNAIAMYYVSQKTGIQGSPRVTKFVDSDEEAEQRAEPKMSCNKIKKLEKSPQKYPVTPVYARRPRSNLSDIRESLSEQATPTSSTSSILATTPSTSSSTLSDRLRAMNQLVNDACVEEREEDVEEGPLIGAGGIDGEQDEEYDGDKEETLLEEDEDGEMPNLTLREVEESEVVVDAEMIETTAMSPAKPTLVV